MGTGAKVVAINEGTGEMRQTTTDASGLFTVTLLPVGNYTVEVSARDFPKRSFPASP